MEPFPPSICGLPETCTVERPSSLEQGIRDIPFPEEQIEVDSPICTILADGADREACYLELVKKAEELKQEIYS